MLRFLIVFLAISNLLASQNKIAEPIWFKGEHFVIYNKCNVAVIFCENTQQDYTFCGSTRNCQGLYVHPGDTFFVNLENKSQNVNVIADISFQNYLPPVSNYTFQFINNCVPPNPVQVVIPLSAVPGSSFQIVAQNTTYYPPQPPYQATIPVPMTVYIGGSQPMYTTALADFTTCLIDNEIDTTSTDVSVIEYYDEGDRFVLFPNPTDGRVYLINDYQHNELNIHIYNNLGVLVKSLKESTGNFEVENLSNGIYYVHIKNKNNLVAVKKLLVVK